MPCWTVVLDSLHRFPAAAVGEERPVAVQVGRVAPDNFFPV